MATPRQTLGDFGEKLVAKRIFCPGCKRTERTIRLLPASFKCADLICDFCGFLAQVKTVSTSDIETLPKAVLGAAWRPHVQRMDAGIFIPIFIVLKKTEKEFAIYYLPRDLQSREMFVPRKPLTELAKRPGWQGFTIEFVFGKSLPVRIL